MSLRKSILPSLRRARLLCRRLVSATWCLFVSDFVVSSKLRVLSFFSSLVFVLETFTVVIGLMPHE